MISLGSGKGKWKKYLDFASKENREKITHLDPIDEIEKFKEKKIVVYCRSGNRSSKGTKILNKYGFEAVNLAGGMLQWKGPVEKN